MILHLLSKKHYELAVERGYYKPSSLHEEGFIHCSLPHQIVGVANSIYKHEQGLCIMLLDEEKIEAKVIYEDLYNLQEDYPHIYGKLNMDACVGIMDFPCNEDGEFELPEALNQYMREK